jgi:hypothetical protein
MLPNPLQFIVIHSSDPLLCHLLTLQGVLPHETDILTFTAVITSNIAHSTRNVYSLILCMRHFNLKRGLTAVTAFLDTNLYPLRVKPIQMGLIDRSNPCLRKIRTRRRQNADSKSRVLNRKGRKMNYVCITVDTIVTRSVTTLSYARQCSCRKVTMFYYVWTGVTVSGSDPDESPVQHVEE